MNREKVLKFAEESGIELYPYSNYTEKNLGFFAELIEREAQADIKPVLKQLLNILGPTAPTCSGCTAEWQAAIDLIKKELE